MAYSNIQYHISSEMKITLFDQIIALAPKVYYLSSLGGHNCSGCVRHMGGKLGTSRLWSVFSLKGKKGKKTLKEGLARPANLQGVDQIVQSSRLTWVMNQIDNGFRDNAASIVTTISLAEAIHLLVCAWADVKQSKCFKKAKFVKQTTEVLQAPTAIPIPENEVAPPDGMAVQDFETLVQVDENEQCFGELAIVRELKGNAEMPQEKEEDALPEPKLCNALTALKTIQSILENIGVVRKYTSNFMR
ncbi:UNVERIFIED_CONTAM: hypothetical protein FKN15_074547 [Acipenser sinensis]